jgi:hypothetical protein
MSTKKEIKTIKHTFSHAEREQLGIDLAQAFGTIRSIEAEFDGIKSNYKARTAEAEARIDRISSNITNGFDLREAECIVVYRPKDKLKDYYLSDGDVEAGPVLTERMTQEDFQLALPVEEGGAA